MKGAMRLMTSSGIVSSSSVDPASPGAPERQYAGRRAARPSAYDEHHGGEVLLVGLRPQTGGPALGRDDMGIPPRAFFASPHRTTTKARNDGPDHWSPAAGRSG